MREIREVLRLRALQYSHHRIATALGMSSATVHEYLLRATVAEITWPLPDELTDAELEIRLFQSQEKPPEQGRAVPDWPTIHRELRRKGVTRELLWKEYIHQHPDGFRYVWFCEAYRTWAKTIDYVMRQDHPPGQAMSTDFSGMRMHVTNPSTGVQTPVEIFVAALQASSYTYVEAVPTQSSEDVVMVHARTFEFFGGVPRDTIVDNLKAAVKHPHRYEPEVARPMELLAQHYGTVVVPTRVRKPRDKSKVENAVQQVERWVLAPLRDRTFFSLHELNTAIWSLLEELNRKPFSKLEGSRWSVYQEMDKPALMPLPARRYEYATEQPAKPGPDYHVEVDHHYYSVPYRLVGTVVTVRATSTTVEVFSKGQRIASHLRSNIPYKHTTVLDHMPPEHAEHAKWTPERLVHWASTVGPACSTLLEALIASKVHPEHAYRPCLGILRLGDHYGRDRLERACSRVNEAGVASYHSVERILKLNLDDAPSDNDHAPARIVAHANIRGSAAFQ